ncbi:MAG: hypothetical protein ABEJ27_07195 [Halodesulfurarchaeum sp.]
MILQVAARSLPSPVRAVLDGDAVIAVSTVEAARQPQELPDAVLIDRGSLDDADSLIHWLRSSESFDPRVPLIVLVERSVSDALPLLAYDTVLHLPTDQETVEAAVEDAVAISEYRAAVADLYDRCVERARDGDGPVDVGQEVLSARERADEYLSDLPDDPAVFAALLAEPVDAEE